MAHSHVQRMLREAMGLDGVLQDGDGDYPFRHGTAVYYLSVGRDGHLLRIWSYAVNGLKDKGSVLREINDANALLTHSRAYLSGGSLVIEAIIPIQPLVPAYLAAVCEEVGETADRVGQLLATVYGGRGAFDFESEDAG